MIIWPFDDDAANARQQHQGNFSGETLEARGLRCDNLIAEWAPCALQASERRGTYLAISVLGGNVANRLNLHIDETGSQDLSEGLYLVAVVLHDHSEDIAAPTEAYKTRLAVAGLPDVPFHGKELLHGNESYQAVSPGNRRRLLTQFARLVRELPLMYFTLRYDVSDTHTRDEFESRIRRDLASLIYDNLAFFQGFSTISVYYDNGQGAVSVALHEALDFVLAKNVADYRDASHSERRLLQAADYICTIERASIAYDAGTQSPTQVRFFGNRRSFMQSYMKQLARKRFS